MGFALTMDHNTHGAPISEEAKGHLESAQVSDLAFIVRRIASKRLRDEDIIYLASILNEALRESPSVSKQQVIDLMLRHGRSRVKAEELSAAIFK